MPLYKDPSGREPSAGVLARVGVLVLIAVVLIGYLISTWTSGGFSDRFTVTLVSNQVGDGLQAGTDVRFRGLRIGKVDSVGMSSTGQQQVVLDLDPTQARALTTDVVPVYTASSMFTSTDIEFVAGSGGGQVLRNNQTLNVRTNTSLGTLTNVLGRAGKITSTLGDPDVYLALQRLSNDADPYVALLREFLPIAADLTKSQKMPVATLLSDLADIVGAVRPMIVPAFGVIDLSLDSTAYMDDPAKLKNTTDAINGLSKKIVLSLGGMLSKNNASLTQVIRLALDLATPTVLSLASFPRAYDRLTAILQGTSDAFSKGADGRTRLNVELILANAPQVAAPALISKEVGPR